MGIENEEYPLAKENRRKKKDSGKTRVITHQTKLTPHLPGKKDLEKQRHESDRKAMRRKK